MSNSRDKVQFDNREAVYVEIIEKYSMRKVTDW